MLTFHRGSYLINVAFDITNGTSAPITPEAYFQLLRDTKQAVVQSSMAPAAYVGPVVYNDKDNFKKVDFGDIDKQAADPNRKPVFTKSADNGWVGMIEHYFVAAWLPPTDRPIQRQFYTEQGRQRAVHARACASRAGTIAPGRRARSARACTSGRRTRTCSPNRQGPGPRRRLRHLHRARRAALRAPQVAARAHRQLGLGDRRDDDHDQGRVLSAQCGRRALDGQDEDHRAQDEGAAGAVRERQAAAADQDDGDVQDGEDQSAGRMPADPRADPGVHRAVLGAACRRSSCARRRGSCGSRTCRRRIRTSCCR